MFTFKLINNSLNSIRLSRRYISNGPGRLGLFKNESQPIENTLEIIDHEEIDPEMRQKEIKILRNKSRLLASHRNMLNCKVPYANSESWVHETLKYKRKLYAIHGSESNVDPRICFYTKQELNEKIEYERVAFPKTVPEMIAINEQQKRERREKIAAREVEIAKNLEKLENWKKDIQMRKEKRETDARVAKERKDRLIEEVRRHFGYTIDPRDERFKELLEQKEKAQRKALKENKRQQKEAKLIEKFAGSKNENSGKVKENPEDIDEEDEKKQ